MSTEAPGARWFAHWLRMERQERGLDRRSFLRRSRGEGGDGLTVTLLADLECGDRLPSLRRVPALARALSQRPEVVAEVVRLAPFIEPAWLAMDRAIAEPEVCSRRARSLCEHGDVWRAAATADHGRRIAAGEARLALELVLAAALARQRFGTLARELASSVLEATERQVLRDEACLVTVESWIAEEKPKTAQIWAARLADAAPGASGARDSIALRRAFARAGIALGLGENQRAAELLLRVVDDARRAGLPALKAAASERLVVALKRAGREREARSWLADREPPTPPQVHPDA